MDPQALTTTPAPFTVTPSTEPDAKWWWGYNDEEFSGPFDTRKAAESDADATGCMEDGCWLTQAVKRALPLCELTDGDELIERLGEAYCNHALGSDHGSEFPSISLDATDDLSARLTAMLNDWQAAHGITLIPWRFAYNPVPAFWADFRLRQDFPSRNDADRAFADVQAAQREKEATRRRVEMEAWRT